MSETITAEAVTGIHAVDAAEWDTCAGAANPFVRHAFLAALEESGCVSAAAGWLPQHLLIRDAHGRVAAAMPTYLKSHSYGEYVFDQGWADAFERAGGRYYPKLQAAVPFTPVTGPRLLAPSGGEQAILQRQLLSAGVALAGERDASSFHITFPTQAEAQLAAEAGLLLRTDQQFHWINAGYRDFADFLDTLSSRKRKQIRKERSEALAGGIEIETLTSQEIGEADWDAFFSFYMDTGSRKWGRPYLNRAFFSLLGQTMGDAVVLVMARRRGVSIAGALNLVGSEALYGRYWGCSEPHPFLHFEVCYYRAIDHAIAKGLVRVEAGAQGPHKLARGYVPVKTYSAHWISNPQFRNAVARYLKAERQDVDAALTLLKQHTPFKKGR